jgi:hypothetical protein
VGPPFGQPVEHVDVTATQFVGKASTDTCVSHMAVSKRQRITTRQSASNGRCDEDTAIDRRLAKDARLLRRIRRSGSLSAAGCQAMDVHLVRMFILAMQGLRAEFIEAQAREDHETTGGILSALRAIVVAAEVRGDWQTAHLCTTYWGGAA